MIVRKKVGLLEAWKSWKSWASLELQPSGISDGESSPASDMERAKEKRVRLEELGFFGAGDGESQRAESVAGFSVSRRTGYWQRREARGRAEEKKGWGEKGMCGSGVGKIWE